MSRYPGTSTATDLSGFKPRAFGAFSMNEATRIVVGTVGVSAVLVLLITLTYAFA